MGNGWIGWGGSTEDADFRADPVPNVPRNFTHILWIDISNDGNLELSTIMMIRRFLDRLHTSKPS
jgi:hypothetical protein